eukprot:COSAG05_NODE_711_length_7822_cov_11.919720_7_plen_114_part_00
MPQNLALNEIGKPPLRSHPSVIASLRLVATAEGGKSELARQYASGALFELDEAARLQKANDAAAASKASGSDGGGTGDTTTDGHVMLSYNWDHQAVVKRINASLQASIYICNL